jgi:hypothetical protein
VTWTRASELHRALKCPASCVLPRPPRRETGRTAAQTGTELHAWAAGSEVNPTYKHRVISVERPWEGMTGEKDVLLALDCADDSSLVFTGAPEMRKYLRDGLADSCVAGEADYADWFGADTGWQREVTVRDLKTGWHPGPPVDLPQIRFYALALLRAVGANKANVSVDWFPALEPGHPSLSCNAVLTRGDLEQWWSADVVPAWRLVREVRQHQKDEYGTPENFRLPGPHCSWCPCTGCPSHYDNNEGDIVAEDTPGGSK